VCACVCVRVNVFVACVCTCACELFTAMQNSQTEEHLLHDWRSQQLCTILLFFIFSPLTAYSYSIAPAAFWSGQRE